MPLFNTCLCLFALLANAGFIWSSLLLTPKGKLNPFNALFRDHWLSNLFLLSTAFLSYWLPELVVTLVTAVLLGAAWNAAQIPLVRAIGEEEILRIASKNAVKEKFWLGLLIQISPSLFYVLLTPFFFLFFHTPDTWGFFIALGVACYSILVLICTIVGYLRFRKLGRADTGAK